MRRPQRLASVLAPTALVLALAAAPASAASSGPGHPGPARDTVSLLQMNVCLSGYAGCYPGTEYPAVVDEAVDKIQAQQPDAVTLNEACSGDVERIAEETGYDQRFSVVIYGGAPLPCKTPEGRGVFGIAVLTQAPVVDVQEAAYAVQEGTEERRWVCVETGAPDGSPENADEGARFCTSHLSVAGTEAQAAANEAQCRELTSVLASGDRQQPTLFAGDVNRREPCAPPGFWTATDAAAGQLAGIQQAYGSRPTLSLPEVTVLPMTYSDHDALLVESRRHGA